MTNTTFFIETYGCQMNKSRSEHIAQVMIQNGYQLIEDKKRADILLFNTCAVREHASEKAISNIQKTIKDLNKTSRYPIIVIFGCLSQFLKNRLVQRVPGAQIVIGTSNIDHIPQFIEEHTRKKKKILDFNLPSSSQVFDESGYLRNSSHISAYLPITYGCDNFCSYCVVPYTTGPQRSKPLRTILTDIEKIIQDGYKEIILLGQNVNSYGLDLDLKNGFEVLLQAIEQNFHNSSFWIRFLTSHPKDMRPSIVDIVKNSSIMAHYFHLPIQSGSDRILSAMNRGYTRDHYLKLAKYIRQNLPDSGIGTDMIVGFPGETERDFLDTLNIVQEVHFDQAYTYIYSSRSGTAAYQLPDHLPLAEKKKRLQFLNQTLSDIHQIKLSNWVGKKTKILIDQIEGMNSSGRTTDNQRIYLPNTNFILGQVISVVVIKTLKGKLYGELVLS
ncbi:tRNA-2-methylthio-N(6)-dimethylallyladenosine synthase [Atribacter laminatus]|uniref:tRNA-2-methylthio-N(6)-dimethylallyladenosine synthase n=2 Tax=Atribacter laminatus TaxID=2847778 RepID=A0A7T1ANR8_ATRLM|nr:tRNA-2-methylthio-N(6)-dimethylallyladenosine synthase [Atribacter laminatus]